MVDWKVLKKAKTAICSGGVIKEYNSYGVIINDYLTKSDYLNYMRKKHSLSAVIIATTLVACSQNELLDSPRNVCEFYDGEIERIDSRVTLDGSYMMNWEMADQLTVFPKYDVNNLYEVVQMDDSRASFGFVSTEDKEGNGIDAHYAVYPYYSVNSISDEVITTQFPSVIEYSGNENAIRHAVMTAKSVSNSFTFTNAMGILHLKVNAKQPFMIGKVQSIQLMSKTKGLCGIVTVDYSDNQTTPSAAIDAVTDNGTLANGTLTVNLVESLQTPLPKAGDNENYSEFYIPLAPETFEANDLLLVINGSETRYSKYISCEVEIERRKIFTLTHTISPTSYDGDIEN